MSEQSRLEPNIFAAAERQMQTWVKTQEAGDRAVQRSEAERLAESVRPYLAISREEGTGGSEIARTAAGRLGWEVLDRELLDRVAERLHVSPSMLELVDETPQSWVRDVLGAWMDGKTIAAEKYAMHLSSVILAAARQASVVLVGRGAQFVLPRPKGIAVRLIASNRYRADQVMHRDNIDSTQAARRVEELDEGRRQFVQRYFHRDIDEPHLYDLVINVERIGPKNTVEQIVRIVTASA